MRSWTIAGELNPRAQALGNRALVCLLRALGPLLGFRRSSAGSYLWNCRPNRDESCTYRLRKSSSWIVEEFKTASENQLCEAGGSPTQSFRRPPPGKQRHCDDCAGSCSCQVRRP